MRLASSISGPVKGAIAGAAVVALMSTAFFVFRPGNENVEIGFIGGPASNTNQSAAKGMALDSMRPYWGGGTTILEPGVNVSNDSGEAIGYRFDAEGIDSKKLVNSLAKTLGLTGQPTFDSSGSLAFLESEGNYLSISDDNLASFSGFNNSRSPWQCGQVIEGESGVGGIKEPATGSGASSAPSSPGSTSPEPAPDRCGDNEKFSTVKTANAISLVKKALADLGVNPAEMIISSNQYSNNEVGVSAYPLFEKRALSMAWSFNVSSEGIYSLNGFFAKIKEIGKYQIDGARDVALRSQQTKWSTFSPVMIRSAEDQANNASSAGPSSVSTSTDEYKPETKLVDGLPTLSAFVNTVKVIQAKGTLIQQYTNTGQVLLLPGWEYLDDKGNLWAMVAVAEKYIDFTSSPYYGGPMPMYAEKAQK